jgi:hypothetical protein
MSARTVQSARIVRTPAGLAWQLGDGAGGKLRRELAVLLRFPKGGGTYALASVQADHYPEGTTLEVEGRGLVRDERGGR